MYKTRSPVLFLVFNRPECTGRVFEAIRNAAPARLYVAADGPRTGKANEASLCAETREIIGGIDWPCEVRTLFRSENLGCKNAVSSAITWYFGQEEEGIILEDDCLPNEDFFRFCDEMLEKYRYDTRIRQLCGCNPHFGKTWGDGSYYYSSMAHVWGWASWRRVWNEYDKDLKQFPEDEVYGKFLELFDEPILAEEWTKLFHELRDGTLDTWDFQQCITSLFNHGLNLIPNVNLISNIGFGDGATHTLDVQSKYANLPLQPLGEIRHPTFMLPEREADRRFLFDEFGVEAKKRKRRSLKQRLKRLWKKAVKQVSSNRSSSAAGYV